MKNPKIYKLILAFALAATFPLSAFAVDNYFPSIAAVGENTAATQQETETPQDNNEESTQSDENIKYIKDVEIHGTNVISDEEILSKLNLHKGDVFKRESIKDGLNAVYATGYFTEKMRALPVNNPDGTITLKIILEENAPITDFTIEGNTVLSTEEILTPLLPLKGKPQNIAKLNEAVEKIQAEYNSKGYILARIESVTDDPDGTVNIKIQEGIINSIAISGNKKTKDYVVARNILTEPGTVYNENQIRQDLVRLYATQAFKDVTREIEPCEDDPDKYDVTINVQEPKGATTVSVGAGLDSVTGVFGNVGIANNNFRGLNQRISLNGIVGTGTILNDSSIKRRMNMQFDLSFFEPHFLNADTSLLAKLFYRDYGSYQVPLAIERRFGGEATIAHRMKKNKYLTSRFTLGVENINVREGDFNKISDMYASAGIPISERAKELSGGLFMTLSPALVYDTRDNSTVTRKGTIANIRFDESFCLNGFNKTHGKLSGSIKQYIPIGKKSSLSFMARAGGKIHGDHMPEVMAYHLGGPYSVRGYKMSAVGTGNAFIMGSMEFATPIPFLDRTKLSRGKMGNFLNNIRLTAFVDAGKVFDKTIASTLYDRPMYGVSAGVGVKLYVPGMGPISIDYGIPFTNVGKYGSKHGYFTFGAGDFIY
ncbi:MAG: BamA/TamA family outer membrane protein [Candidatus Gastranaerophilaceae bacterium]|nr:BamA/TamA family outer membrane protein [Candidatus Gastranaerophilaceae bacterium]